MVCELLGVQKDTSTGVLRTVSDWAGSCLDPTVSAPGMLGNKLTNWNRTRGYALLAVIRNPREGVRFNMGGNVY